MWKRLRDTEYFLFFSKEGGYEIYITDFFCIWNTVYSEKAFLAELKESNDGLELQDDNEFIQKGLHLLTNLDQLKKIIIKKEENGKHLFISMKISFGFPFTLECKFIKGSEVLFFQKITQPMFKTIGDLRASQSELRRLLIKKDNEIDEYKCEGGEIVLRHLKTIAFNDEEHMKLHKAYEENFGELDLVRNVSEKIVDIPQQNALKQEPITTENLGPASNIKVEPTPNVKAEPMSVIKEELKTEMSEVTEEPTSSVPVLTPTMGCKQEVKRETTMRTHIPRKRSKMNL